MSTRGIQGRSPRSYKSRSLKKAVPGSRGTPKNIESRCDVPIVRPRRSWSPNRKTDMIVVLDLDQTLVYSEGFGSSDTDRRYVIEIDDETHKGSTRPNLKNFLTYLDKYAKEVVVWTAATKEYADMIVEITHENLSKPGIVLARDSCAWDENGGFYHKPIERIASMLDCDPSSILIIDDKTYTFQENPSNGLLIPPYTGSNNDDALGQIVDWLDTPKVRHSWSTTQLCKDRVFAK